MREKLLEGRQYKLHGLSKINILLGKNGCGKSTLLKEIESIIRSNTKYGTVKYITPERGGVLVYNPGVDNDISSNNQWLHSSRRKNRIENFREQSVAQFKTFEFNFLRELEATPELRQNSEYGFQVHVTKINSLLDNIEIKRDVASFKIYKKGTADEVSPESISSGESELISLGIECLVFEQECVKDKCNVLLLDEPDVHLHPDLQARLGVFLKDLVSKGENIIIVATHSTAFLGALEDFPDAYIAFMHSNQTELTFSRISDEYKKILPVFGANPLSNIFNKTPIFLVEGEDDERIWQQAIRSAGGKLKIYPCSTGGQGQLKKYEDDVESIISSIYDNAKAFSLRDKDEGDSTIHHLKIIKRYKLQCRASENLLLSDEVLSELGVNWDELKVRIDGWLDSKTPHPYFQDMLKFKNGGYNRKEFNLKNIRNVLMYIIESSLTWEIAVGKAIGLLFKKNGFRYSEGSLGEFLGKELIEDISCGNNL